ncbi:MAG: hypothetical protein JWN67_4304 [Actinomycetia bacterium]|nr:hypothetical protein [Actinomycetes bacterium]
MKTRREQLEPWSVPVTALLLGLVALLAFGIGGDWSGGVVSLGIMLAYAAILLVGRRFESFAVLGGQDLDERRRAIGQHAAAWTSYVLISLVLANYFWDVAHGRLGEPWAQLGAVAGLTFMASVVVLRRRR